MSLKTSTVLGWGAALATSIIWAVTGAVSKPLSIAIDPMTLVFFRYCTAVIGLIIIFALTYKVKSINKELGSSLYIKKTDILKISFCGIIGQGCFSFFNFLSLGHIGVTENIIVQGMFPFATIIFGMLFMHFKMNKIQWAAFIVSALCVYAVSTGPTNVIEGGEQWKGFIYVTISMLSVAWTAYLRASLAEKYGSVVSMLYQYIAVSIVGIIVVFILNLDLSQIKIIFSSPLLLSLLIFLGMGISGGSYLIQLYSFKHVGIENSTMLVNLMPLVGYIVSILAFNEQMTLFKTILILLICVALFFFTRYSTTPDEKK